MRAPKHKRKTQTINSNANVSEQHVRLQPVMQPVEESSSSYSRVPSCQAHRCPLASIVENNKTAHRNILRQATQKVGLKPYWTYCQTVCLTFTRESHICTVTDDAQLNHSIKVLVGPWISYLIWTPGEPELQWMQTPDKSFS